jgi:hypothetical protein
MGLGFEAFIIVRDFIEVVVEFGSIILVSSSIYTGTLRSL